MKEVFNRRSLAKELRIRNNVIIQSIRFVDGEVFGKAQGSLDRYRALFDHQPVSLGLLSDLAGHGFNSGKISLAVLEGRSSYTDKKSLAAGDCIIRRRELKTAQSAVALHHGVQVRLVKRKLALFQAVDFGHIVVRAKHA